MDTSGKTNKQQLRQRAKQTLATLSSEEKKQQSQKICNKLSKYIDQYDTRVVYVAFSYEPDISYFIQQLWDNKKTVLLPQIHNGDMHLALYTRESIITQGVHGEAKIENPVWYDGPLDVCLVPGLAFDTNGYRLGHGYGYYDRFLAENKCFRIGIGFLQTTITHIPIDTRDQAMDIVLH